MKSDDVSRQRFRTVDGASFRFEKKAGHLFLNERPLLKVRVLNNGVVALQTDDQQVTIDGATYWDILFDDEAPTKMRAGLRLARNDELFGRLRSIQDVLVQRLVNACVILRPNKFDPPVISFQR
jgi:hypothetical protein